MLRFRSSGLRFRVFGCFVFDLVVFVFEFLGASFSIYGSSFSSFWVLRFRSRGLRFQDLGASCFGRRFRVLRFPELPFVQSKYSSRKPTSSTLSAIQGSISSSFRNHEEHLSKLAKSELT